MATDTAGDPPPHDSVSSPGWLGGLPESVWGWLSITPVLLLYTIVALCPITFAVVASFHDVHLLNPQWSFVGLSNYVEVFQIDRFWGSMWRGVLFMVGSTLVQFVVGVWMALVIDKLSRTSRLVSTLVFTSYLVPTIVVTVVFEFMLDPYDGVVHAAGSSLGLWNDFLLGNTELAMAAVVVISSWKFAAFVSLFTLAQLRSIPDRFYEAARVCGATRWEQFRDITFPRIRGALAVVVFLRAIFMFNKYDVIWQLTEGGPGSATTTMPILAFKETFQMNAYGRGNAIAVIMFLVLFAGGVLYLRAINPSQEVQT
ncbi:carbohydrate ABC transporter permease [Halocatena halophila]|uniref:carbohydrate ABC transporter permease n=1 Tax=Halocatena halophila TaxID=2814576 RepID=UPI002ED0E7B2